MHTSDLDTGVKGDATRSRWNEPSIAAAEGEAGPVLPMAHHQERGALGDPDDGLGRTFESDFGDCVRPRHFSCHGFSA